MIRANTFEEAAEAIEQCEKDLRAAMETLYGKLAGTRIHISDVEMTTSEVWLAEKGEQTLAIVVEVSIETEFRNRK